MPIDVSAGAPPDACPECGGKMAKIMSRNSFQLKGGGWYRDLYSSSGRKGDAAGTTSGNSTPAADSGDSGGSGTAKEAAETASWLNMPVISKIN